MLRKTVFAVILVSLFVLSGCATARKQKDQEIQGLRNQLSVLEMQVQSKDEEINSLRETLNRMEMDMQSAASQDLANRRKTVSVPKSRPSAKQIQTALANAGYNPGQIDGRIGRQTKDAIKAFQKANNLPADGRVGKNTWAVLKVYLNKKVK